MKQWLIRCAVLIAAAGILAVASAAIRPFPKSFLTKQTAPPKVEEPSVHAATDGATSATLQLAAPTGPDAEGNVADIAWVRAKFEDQSFFFVDARPIDQYREGHLAGAFYLAFEEFQSGTPKVIDLLRGTPLIIYCSGGDCDASHKVKTMLDRYGLTDLYVFTPGYPGLLEADFPIEQGDPLQ